MRTSRTVRAILGESTETVTLPLTGDRTDNSTVQVEYETRDNSDHRGKFREYEITRAVVVDGPLQGQELDLDRWEAELAIALQER